MQNPQVRMKLNSTALNTDNLDKGMKKFPHHGSVCTHRDYRAQDKLMRDQADSKQARDERSVNSKQLSIRSSVRNRLIHGRLSESAELLKMDRKQVTFNPLSSISKVVKHEPRTLDS